VKPRKKHGQSFLKSSRVAQDIINLANLTDQDQVLEIGGGFGILTKLIAERAKHVYVIELDSNLVRALHDMARDYRNVTVIEGDALIVELPRVKKVVANLPYSISSEMTFRILRELDFEEATLMYQKEFANRLLADPGTTEYSRLTINVRYYVEVQKLLEVPAKSFYPEPAVDSSVIMMKPRSKGSFAKDTSVFQWMIGGIYPYPNKNLQRALRIWFRNLGIEKSRIDEVLSHLVGVLSGDERLRTIDLEKLISLADVLLMMIENGSIEDPRV